MQIEFLIVLTYLTKKDPKGMLEIIDTILSQISTSRDIEALKILKQRTLRILKTKENGFN